MKHRKRACVGAGALAVALVSGVAPAAEFITPAEAQQKNQWVKDHVLDPDAPQLPFSFVYDGQTSAKWLGVWPKTTGRKALDRTRTQHTITWTDPTTGLEIRYVAVDYADYPAIEWTVYCKNAGTKITPILESLQGLDVPFERGPKGEFTLHGIKGDWCAPESYEPYVAELGPGAIRKCGPESGKSTGGPAGWPYYNLQMPGGGVILAVGWPGQWASSFVRDGAGRLRIQAGQERTHLSLKPGEEIRAPLIALLFWKGTDVVRAQNLWRRWYRAHTLPRVNGKPVAPLAQIQSGGREGAIAHAERYLQAGIKVDVCWTDAGWYVGGAESWLNTGEWEPDPARYPHGFRSWSDWVHAHGMKFLLWFEPERVGNPHCWLAEKHPEWLLADTSHGRIFDLGNPAALHWLIDHLDGMIKTQGIDWYREDMNGVGPLVAWQKADAADRQGVTENLYVQGHLHLWDELVRRNPRLQIDSCASGGRRNDLETMRRAVPLLRSDFQFPQMPHVIEGNQGHTYGLSSWLPYYGSGSVLLDKYYVRSFYMPAFGAADWANDAQRAAVQRAYAECRQIAPLMLGDYYPLTPYSLSLDQWIGWQFDRPETGDGVVQAFRRDKCDDTTTVLHLRGLDPAASYAVTDFDAGQLGTRAGKELMETGLTVTITDKPGAAVIVYKRLQFPIKHARQ